MKLRYPPLFTSLLAGLMATLFATLAAADTQTYSALTQAKQPMFAARLSSTTTVDTATLLGRTPKASMEYRIISERLNTRRFFKLLADAAAVNTDAQTLAKNASYISRSRSALPVAILPGDLLGFYFDGDKQVDLRLNGVQLASYPSADFFRMLLATWVGDVPISSRFKREILGLEKPDAEVMRWFEDTQPASDRVAVIENAMKPAESAAPAIALASAPEIAAVPAPKPTAKPKATPIPAPKAAPKPAPKAVAEVAPKSTPKPAAKSTPKPKPAQVKQASTAPAPKEAPVKVLSEEEEARLLLVRQEYLKTLNSEINTFKHLPQRAFSRRAEGSVRLAIWLDKNGKLQKVEIVEPSRYEMFNEQALEAVANAQPFPPPPAELESDPFEFETTLYYDLPL